VSERARPGLAEVVVAWGFHGVVAAAVFATYTRLGPEALYNVSGSGVEGGASRVLVFLGYPTSLVVMAFLPFLAQRLDHPLASAAALVSFSLCLTIGIPGMLEPSDLDAKPGNLLAGAGVAIALGLTVLAVMRGGLGDSPPFGRWDWLRATVAGLLVVAAVPWIAAELGFFVRGPVFMSEEVVPEAGHPEIRAVHLGHHHGIDGVLLAWTALLLTRVTGQLRRPLLRVVVLVWLSLMLVYGLANALEDFWLEQLVKRGVLDDRLPSMLRPRLSVEWGALLTAAALICLALRRVDTVHRPSRRSA
jgi:hypothetical protein